MHTYYVFLDKLATVFALPFSLTLGIAQNANGLGYHGAWTVLSDNAIHPSWWWSSLASERGRNFLVAILVASVSGQMHWLLQGVLPRRNDTRHQTRAALKRSSRFVTAIERSIGRSETTVFADLWTTPLQLASASMQLLVFYSAGWIGVVWVLWSFVRTIAIDIRQPQQSKNPTSHRLQQQRKANKTYLDTMMHFSGTHSNFIGISPLAAWNAAMGRGMLRSHRVCCCGAKWRSSRRFEASVRR